MKKLIGLFAILLLLAVTSARAADQNDTVIHDAHGNFNGIYSIIISGMKKTSYILRFLCLLGALLGVASCASFKHQPNGQISIHVVSWPLVKKLAEPDAGLPNQKVALIKLADHSVIAEKSTDVYGNVLFDVPAGTYTVSGIGMGLENVKVEAGQTVTLKLIVHYDTPLRPYKRRLSGEGK